MKVAARLRLRRLVGARFVVDAPEIIGVVLLTLRRLFRCGVVATLSSRAGATPCFSLSRGLLPL